MLADSLVGGLRGGDGLFLQAFTNFLGLLGRSFQFGSKFALLGVSMFCCLHRFFSFFIQPRTTVGPSQQQPLRCGRPWVLQQQFAAVCSATNCHTKHRSAARIIASLRPSQRNTPTCAPAAISPYLPVRAVL